MVPAYMCHMGGEQELEGPGNHYHFVTPGDLVINATAWLAHVGGNSSLQSTKVSPGEHWEGCRVVPVALSLGMGPALPVLRGAVQSRHDAGWILEGCGAGWLCCYVPSSFVPTKLPSACHQTTTGAASLE
jgi:hypothetical protein